MFTFYWIFHDVNNNLSLNCTVLPHRTVTCDGDVDSICLNMNTLVMLQMTEGQIVASASMQGKEIWNYTASSHKGAKLFAIPCWRISTSPDLELVLVVFCYSIIDTRCVGDKMVPKVPWNKVLIPGSRLVPVGPDVLERDARFSPAEMITADVPSWVARHMKHMQSKQI